LQFEKSQTKTWGLSVLRCGSSCLSVRHCTEMCKCG